MKQLRILFVILIYVLYFASSSVIDTDSQVGRGKLSQTQCTLKTCYEN